MCASTLGDVVTTPTSQTTPTPYHTHSPLKLHSLTTPTHLSIGHHVSIKKADHVPLGDLPVFLVCLAKQEQRDYCRLAGEVR